MSFKLAYYCQQEPKRESNILRFLQTQIPRTLIAWQAFLLLTLLSACQPVSSSLPSPSPVVQSSSTSTIEAELSIATTTPTVSPSLTAISTTAAETESALSQDGPWLIYSHGSELVIVNQDGIGRASYAKPTCDFYAPFSMQEDSLHRTVILNKNVYLIQPFSNTQMQLYSPWPYCHSAYTGDANAGLLAKIYQSTNGATPELIIYEIPSGRIKNQISLGKCADQMKCYFGDMNWWEITWSPNGRYLAFPAIIGGPSTDLYVYDAQNGSTRQLTSGPDEVADLWWSPDGRWIVMGERSEASHLMPPNITSLWAVSVSSNEVHLIRNLEIPSPQGFLGWLDNERFIVYNGTSLYNALDLPASNLRLIDMNSGDVKTLFDGSFYDAEIDADHETVAVYSAWTNQHEQGMYLVSPKTPKITFVTHDQSSWDENRKVFITDIPCENNDQGVQAFDFTGQMQCILPEVPPNVMNAPDGHAKLSTGNGLWLEINGQLFQVSTENPTQIIWSPDSSYFFFVANHSLYSVTLSDRSVRTVEKQVGTEIVYQWLK